MKVKTSELKDLALDWAVAKCEGRGIEFEDPRDPWLTLDGIAHQPLHSYNPSTDWAQGGPIIEREQLNLSCLGNNKWEVWPNYGMNDTTYCKGPTPLIAAMRCYVASKLGNEVEVQEDLI